jgi:N-acetylglucosaminyl-diphospho-decaprenol L-rhamnosyltransferase
MSIDFSVLVVTYNSRNEIGSCLDSINSVSKGNVEIIVVDNCSNDGTADFVSANYPIVSLIRNGSNIGYAAANNVAFSVASGSVICLVNPDIIVQDNNTFNWAREFFDSNPKAGILAYRMVGYDGTPQDSIRSFPRLLYLLVRGLKLERVFKIVRNRYIINTTQIESVAAIDWAIGAFLMLRREMIESIGFLDSGFFMYYEDADICRRASLSGWQVIYSPLVTVVHGYKRESARNVLSRLTWIHLKSILRYFIKHVL